MAINIRQPAGTRKDLGGITLQVDWADSFAADWSAKYSKVQYMLDSEILRRMSPYVPVKTHTLEHSPIYASDIGSGLLVYATTYAAAQYYNTANTRPYDPIRGGHWADRMKADQMPALERFAQRAMTVGGGNG